MSQFDKAAVEKQLNRAYALVSKGNHEEAEAIFQQLAAQPVPDDEIRLHLGNLALQLGEHVFAAGEFASLLQEQPDNITLLFGLARASYALGNKNKARELLQQVLQLNPDMPEACMLLGEIEIDAGDHFSAVELLQHAIRKKASNPIAHHLIVIALRALGRFDEALEHAEKLLRLQNTSLNHAVMSRVLIEMGRQNEALRHLEKAIAMDKTCGIAYHDIASIRKFTPDDQKLVLRFEKALDLAMPAQQCSFIHFALGKIYNDCKQYDRAFEHYRLANSLVKQAVEPDYCAKQVKKSKSIYTKKLLQQADSIGSDSRQPVFIVGMPRSGTTLIEQIIASHPQGAGAGELTDIQMISSRLVPDDDVDRAHIAARLNRETVSEQVEAYLRNLRAGRETASRIVDKMPVNYIHLGLIHLMFPRSTIIHALRNPLDTCLSCYFQTMQSVPASFDLEWLANEYRLYRKTMDHWSRVLPPGRIMELHYEQLISEPETQMQRLIEGCGLEWDSACLEFYKSERAIGTASLWQARQPIYSSSRRRWINYAEHIGELAKALRDYLDEEDIAELRRRDINIGRAWLPAFLR